MVRDLKDMSIARISLVVFFIFCSLFVFTIRLFYLQVFQGSIFTDRAVSNQTKSLIVPPYRSIIYDRNRELKFADNRRSIVLTLTRDLLPKDKNQRKLLIDKLALILDKKPQQLRNLIFNRKIDNYTPVLIQEDIPLKTLLKIAENIDEYPGVFWENRPKRIYPFKESSFHVVGYTGLLNEEEIQEYKGKEEYFMDSIIGKGGIEKQYDAIIRGRSGLLLRTVNASGHVLQQDIFKEPVQGDHLVLSIDARLQEKAFTLIKDYVGSIIISKATTGEILAIVSSPSIDPSIFNNSNDAKYRFLAVKSSPQNPFFNRSIQGRYPPASAFKMIVSMAFYHNGVDPKKILHTTGSYKVGNRIFKDWRNNGSVNMEKAIAASANVYYYHHSQLVGRNAIFEMAKDFGIGSPFDIDLPNENIGFLPDDEWFIKAHRRRWSSGDTANISIGQGDVLMTPLELNMVTATIANGGIIHKPFILKEKLSFRDKSVIWSQKSSPLKIMTVSPHIFTMMQTSLHQVVQSSYGTANWLVRTGILKVPIAGKTGTAQIGTLKDNNGIFTAYAPYGKENLENAIVVTVFLEENNTGKAVHMVAALCNYYFIELYPHLNPRINK